MSDLVEPLRKNRTLWPVNVIDQSAINASDDVGCRRVFDPVVSHTVGAQCIVSLRYPFGGNGSLPKEPPEESRGGSFTVRRRTIPAGTATYSTAASTGSVPRFEER